MFDSVASDTVIRKWLSSKPYCLTVALPSGSLTWQRPMALYSVQKRFVRLIQPLVTQSPCSLTTKAHFPSTLINLLLPFCCQQCLLRFSSTTLSLFQLLFARFVGFFLPFASGSADGQLVQEQSLTGQKYSTISLNEKRRKINVFKLHLHLAATNCLQIGQIVFWSCTIVVFGRHCVLEQSKKIS